MASNYCFASIFTLTLPSSINATVVVYPESSQIVQAHFVQNPITIELFLHVRKRKQIFLDLMTYFIFLYYFKGKKSLQLLPGGKISYATEKTRETVSKGFTLCWIRRKSKEKIRVQVVQQKTKNSSWC